MSLGLLLDHRGHEIEALQDLKMFVFGSERRGRRSHAHIVRFCPPRKIFVSRCRRALTEAEQNARLCAEQKTCPSEVGSEDHGLRRSGLPVELRCLLLLLRGSLPPRSSDLEEVEPVRAVKENPSIFTYNWGGFRGQCR